MIDGLSGRSAIYAPICYGVFRVKAENEEDAGLVSRVSLLCCRMLFFFSRLGAQGEDLTLAIARRVAGIGDARIDERGEFAAQY